MKEIWGKWRRLGLVLVVFFGLVLLAACPRRAAAADSDFSISEGELERYYGNDTEVTVPDTVTKIGDHAFSSTGHGDQIRKVILPSSVKEIDMYAFYGCPSLEEVVFSEGLTKIGSDAFGRCSKLKELAFPRGLTSVGNAAFAECSALTSVTFEDGKLELGFRAFDGCRSLQTVALPSGLQSIEQFTFSECSSLRQVTLPEGLLSLELSAFEDCVSLSQITLPESLLSIGGSVFSGCTSLSRLRIPKGVTDIDFDAYSGFVECYKGTAGFDFARRMGEGNYRILDGTDFSSVKVTLAKSSFVYNDEAQMPEVKVTDGKNTLPKTYYRVMYADNIKAGIASVKVTALPEESEGAYFGNKTVTFNILPRKVQALASGLKTSSGKIELVWQKRQEAAAYEVQIYRQKKWKSLKNVTKNTYTNSGLKADTAYKYRVRAYVNTAKGKLFGAYSQSLSVTTLPAKKTITATEKKRKAGASAQITTVKTKIKAQLSTDNWVGSNWSFVSSVSQFTDQKGNYCFAYESGKYLYIQKYSSSLKSAGTLKIKKKYPQFGGIVCDQKGYLYLVWGKTDEKAKGNVDTMAISKYTSKGKHVKTVKYYTDKNAGKNKTFETRVPFEAGNCDIILKDGVLICSYARVMYNGHQSNGVISVNTSTMKKLEYYNYVSHSFNQSLLATGSGHALFANHGDAYPRGFDVALVPIDKSAQLDSAANTPFHFYGTTGDNYTGAELGGIAEVSSGYVLAAAAPRAMTSKADSQKRDVFIQVLDKADLNSKLKASTRKGTSGGVSAKDKGILWLTNNSGKYQVTSVSVTATDDDRVVVMWEKHNQNGFVDSYYMILAANGTVLQKATSLNHRRLNAYEDPIYRKGCIYWTSCGNAKQAVTMKLKIGSLKASKKK